MKKRLLIFALTSLALFTAVNVVRAQSSSSNPWMAWKVLSSDRSDVEKLFPRPKDADNSHFVIYDTDYGSVSVEYSVGPCESSADAEWNIPEWTITKLVYTPWRNPPKFSEVISNERDYERRQAGDVKTHVEYFNLSTGFSVIYDTWNKVVVNIVLKPGADDNRRRRCVGGVQNTRHTQAGSSMKLPLGVKRTGSGAFTLMNFSAQ